MRITSSVSVSTVARFVQTLPDYRAPFNVHGSSARMKRPLPWARFEEFAGRSLLITRP
jgi:hypothetical protein